MRVVKSHAGFTLIEIVMVIVLMSALAVVAIPTLVDMRDDARTAVTRDEMAALKRGIVGDARVTSGGTFAFPGYETDVGKLPATLTELGIQPATVTTYDPITRIGWRGPYIDTSPTSSYLTDAWGSIYGFETSPRRIRSGGPNKSIGDADDISVLY